ncbi:MAG: heavy-metal-associated domain-containing protein [Gemmatimonadota bacterium]
MTKRTNRPAKERARDAAEGGGTRSLRTPARFPLAIAVLAGLGLLAGACSDASRGQPEGRAAGAAATSAQAVPLATAEFEVSGMDCGGCALATEIALKKLDGVVSADAEYDENTGKGGSRVRYDPARVTPDRMIAAIAEIGFTATQREESATENPEASLGS